jgi:hypothetical protein
LVALTSGVRSWISSGRALFVLSAYAVREQVVLALAPAPPHAPERLARRVEAPRAAEREPVVALAPRVEEPVIEAPLEVRVEVAPPAIDRGELLRAIARDAGCAVPGGSHDACHAARTFTGRSLDVDAVRTLEATVLQSGRPECVQRAAVEALAEAPTADAGRALARMLDVVEERSAWEGGHAPLLSLLRALPAR